MSITGYTKTGADAVLATKAPISSAWVASTAVKAGQILTNAGTAYTVNADFTTPSTFSATGLTAVASGGVTNLLLSDTRPSSPATGLVRIGLAYVAGDTTPPTTPTGLAGTPGNTTVALTWTASTDNVAVTGYKVYRGGTVVGTPTGTSYTDTGLTNGTAYSYTVSAVDAAGNESAQTSALSKTPTSGADVTPPSTPGTPTATGGDTTAVVTFTGSTDNVAVTGYNVYASTDSYASVKATGTSSPITVTGLTNGTAVTFKVAAYDAAGNVSTKTPASNSVTPASSVTTLVADNFNRADQNSCGAGQVGPVPTVNGFAWIRSDQLLLASGTTDISWDLGSATDYTAQVTAVADPGIVQWRWTDNSNAYRYFTGLGNIYKIIAGATTTIITSIPAVVPGDVVKVVVSGSNHTIFVNGSQVATFTDAALTTGVVDLLANSNATTFDDLTITTP